MRLKKSELVHNRLHTTHLSWPFCLSIPEVSMCWFGGDSHPNRLTTLVCFGTCGTWRCTMCLLMVFFPWSVMTNWDLAGPPVQAERNWLGPFRKYATLIKGSSEPCWVAWKHNSPASESEQKNGNVNWETISFYMFYHLCQLVYWMVRWFSWETTGREKAVRKHCETPIAFVSSCGHGCWKMLKIHQNSM